MDRGSSTRERNSLWFLDPAASDWRPGGTAAVVPAADGMLWRTVDMFLDADPHAERSLGELRDLLARRDHPAVGFVVSAIEVMLTIRGAGRFDKAETLAPGIARPDEVTGDQPMECRRHGRDWRVTLGRRSVVVEHSIGLLHLAVLIANPRQEIPALDLVAGVEAVADGATRDAGSAQPVLDRTAIREYRHRLSQLPAEIDALEARSDTSRAAQARAERDWLIAVLSGASAVGGRTRRFTDDPERARIAVGKAIRRAITRIIEADAVIGENLRGRIRTGIRCSYWPA